MCRLAFWLLQVVIFHAADRDPSLSSGNGLVERHGTRYDPALLNGNKIESRWA